MEYSQSARKREFTMMKDRRSKLINCRLSNKQTLIEDAEKRIHCNKPCDRFRGMGYIPLGV